MSDHGLAPLQVAMVQTFGDALYRLGMANGLSKEDALAFASAQSQDVALEVFDLAGAVTEDIAERARNLWAKANPAVMKRMN